MSSNSSSSSNSCRIHLEQHLEALLGFDDVSDLLGHLLLLSRNDAKSYLSDLTGTTRANDNYNLESFLGKMQDYRSGVRTVPPIYSTTYTSSCSNPDHSKPTHTGSDHSNTRALPQTKPEQTGKKDPKMSQPTASSFSINPVPQAKIYGGVEKKKNQKKEPQKSVVGTSNITASASLLKINPDPMSSNQQTNPIPKNPNSRSGGASRKECGCYGTKHECLTNCLDCGRIACVEEGYGECFFCRKLVLDEEDRCNVISNNHTMKDIAIEKEQWLQRDKEFAKRTVVLDDDQVVDSYSWVIDNTERLQLQAKEEQRRKEMHTTKKDIKMNINF